MSESFGYELELQKQIQSLQYQLEELRDKYDVSQTNTKFIQLEKNEINTELQQIKQENNDLTEKNLDLQNIQKTMELEREHLFQPQIKELQSTHIKQSKLKHQLAIKTHNIQKLSLENMQIKQENEKYKQSLQKYETELRKKDESSQNLVQTLEKQLGVLKLENEELNKQLFKCELDLYSIQKQTLSIISDDEKVSDEIQIQDSLLNHIQDNIEININMDDDVENSNDNPAQCDDFNCKPLLLSTETSKNRLTSYVHRRKTSITLSFNDLASVLERRDSYSGYSLKAQLFSIQSCPLFVLDEMEDIDEDECDYSEGDDGDLYGDVDKDDEIKKLKMENKLLVETHFEIEKELKTKLEKKQKKIDGLKEKNESLKMILSKKSCNLVPWCR